MPVKKMISDIVYSQHTVLYRLRKSL